MPSMPIALEILVGFGIPIAWGVWELVSLRREQARDREKAAEAAAEAAHEAEQEALKYATAADDLDTELHVEGDTPVDDEAAPEE